MDYTNSTNQSGYLLFANKPRTVPRKTEKLQQGTSITGLLYIDQHILKETKTSRKNVTMAWIDYKKTYNNVPQRWLDFLKMYKISEVIKFIENTMKNWIVELTAGGKKLS